MVSRMRYTSTISMPIETITEQFPLDDPTLAETGFYWREHEDVKVLVSIPLEGIGFINGFSTRLGGVSSFPSRSLNLSGVDIDSSDNIQINRSRFLKTLGCDREISTCHQIHGDAIHLVESSVDISDSVDSDALISKVQGRLVGVKTADCVPILIGDKATGAFAAIHAGWRGSVKQIASKTVSRLSAHFGSRVDELHAAIGPAASGRSYEVGPEVVSSFLNALPGSSELFNPTHDGHALVDLHLANFLQLVNAGLRPENISIAPFCTIERTDLFFSHRAESVNGPTGRMLSVIGRK